MFHQIEKHLQEVVSRHVEARYGAGTPVGVESPKQPEFGEMALPVAFQLARAARRAPKQIAAELAAELGPIAGVASLEVAGNGYINVRLDRGPYAEALLKGPVVPAGLDGKIIVEHTNINPNKAAHIGHLRNAVLGDTFVRMLRSRGREVEVQNYIDNTGVQVADVVVGFHHIEKKSPADVQAIIASSARFDYVCWDLYSRVGQFYQQEPTALKLRADALHAIEAGEGEQAKLAHLIADAIVDRHIATMLRLDIMYDVLPRESEILHLRFWATAFELLKERNAIYLETEGKNAGCWVMPGASFKEDADEDSDSKVIVRSNGTVTYVGKDIAYQLWKFGLLGKDFYYRPLYTYPNGYELWVSTDQPQERTHSFGSGSRVYNVIDSRQSYLQDVVQAGLRALGFNEQAERSIHFSYEMVALSPRACTDLGIALSDEDRKRPYVEMSGRKGLGVKADDLIDKLIEEALAEVASRHPEDSPEKQLAIASRIAIGALRYFLLKFTRNSVIAFDFQEALSFTGETGPYLQYACVRARNIWRKLEERGEAVPDFAAELNQEAFARQLTHEDSWQIVLLASKADTMIERAVSSGEPAYIAKYGFELAQAFSNFYQKYPVITEENRERKVFLLWLCGYFRDQLERTLGVLGIEVPEHM
ncbi:MAG TPA: arginine--tRNA ligase [Bryobacteraceae bacterium]|nr:arginine--tRNA ligase [Bryobacteraceae bacterium]